MKLHEFDKTSPEPGTTVYIISVDGGYFSGWSMLNVYLIAQRAGNAEVFTDLEFAVKSADFIRQDAKVLPYTVEPK